MKTLLRSSRLVAFCLLGPAMLGGCASNSLQQIHDTYQKEFVSQLASPGDKLNSASFKVERFPSTLGEISSFRQKHTSLNAANKHLTVLEAMIYLQTGRYGQSRLASSAAAGMAGSLSTYGGGLTRDQLLLEAMQAQPGLIEGWQLLDLPATDPNYDMDQAETAAAKLNEIASSSARGVADGDDGRIYLAAVSAMLRRDLALKYRNAGQPDQAKTHQAEMAAALERHLLPHEKAPEAQLPEIIALSEWAPRYRYVRLYRMGKGWDPL